MQPRFHQPPPNGAVLSPSAPVADAGPASAQWRLPLASRRFGPTADSGSRTLRVLLVIGDMSTPSGMEMQLAHLANGLVTRGHEVCLVSIRSSTLGSSDATYRLDPRVRVTHLRAPTRWHQPAALGRLVSLARASDIVHCTAWDASLWGRLGAALASRPVVVAEHTPGREHDRSLSGRPRARLIALHNRLLDPLTAATVVCAEWQRDLLSAEGVRADGMRLIPNGVPVDALRSQAEGGRLRAELGIPGDAKVLAHVARFTPQKRQELTLEAVAELRLTLGDVRVLFAGDGPERQRVEEMARAQGAWWATFLGRYPEVPSLLGASDLAVLPSSAEAMPMAVVEAIALGVPVVATSVGDVGHLLDVTGAGLHVEPDDVAGFVGACSRALSDGDLRRRLQSAAEDARDHVDSGAMVHRYERLFHEVLDGRRAD